MCIKEIMFPFGNNGTKLTDSEVKVPKDIFLTCESFGRLLTLEVKSQINFDCGSLGTRGVMKGSSRLNRRVDVGVNYRCRLLQKRWTIL